MTEKQSIIEMLRKNEWVCSTQFQANFLPEFRSRISELSKKGYGIISESCLGRCGKPHKSKGLKRWKLITTPQEKAQYQDQIKKVEKDWFNKPEYQRNAVPALKLF